MYHVFAIYILLSSKKTIIAVGPSLSLASFAFVAAQCYTPARPVSVMVMLLFSQKIKTVFMLKAQYQKIITRI